MLQNEENNTNFLTIFSYCEFAYWFIVNCKTYNYYFDQFLILVIRFLINNYCVTVLALIFNTMNGKTLRLLTSAKLLISFRTHLHSLKYLSSNNSSDGSNLFLNVDLEREYFRNMFLHLKFINFKLLMTPMLLFFNNASLKIMNAVIFCSFQPLWRKVKYKTTKFKAIYWCMNFDKDFV